MPCDRAGPPGGSWKTGFEGAAVGPAIVNEITKYESPFPSPTVRNSMEGPFSELAMGSVALFSGFSCKTNFRTQLRPLEIISGGGFAVG